MLPVLRSLYKRNSRSNTIVYLIANSVKNHHVRLLRTNLLRSIGAKKLDHGKLQYLKLQKCNLRTTQRLHIPPILALILRPALRISSLLLGRSIKNWWARKPENEKDQFRQWFRERSHMFWGKFFHMIIG